MKTFTVLSEECTWRNAFDAINETSNNLNDTDFLYMSYLGDGQVFNVNNSIGRVNNIEARRNKNILISKADIASFRISGFQFYDRNTNSTYTVDITCNLLSYADGKVHFLYLVKGKEGTFEVHDTMFENNVNLTLFARFVINLDGDSVQFYVIAPFAGSPDYIKGNQFYEITEGLNLNLFNDSTKQFNLTKGKIRFSGINFDDTANPDVLALDKTASNIKFKYVYWDAADEIPRVNYVAENLVNSPIVNKIMNYETGALATIDENKFTIQKIYYDVLSNVFIAMYGARAYDSLQEALLSIDTIMNYPNPDNIDYLIPIAALIIKNSNENLNDETFRVIGLTHDDSAIFDSNELSRQQSLEAIAKAESAVDSVAALSETISNHSGNKSNPHGVTKSQVGLGNVENYSVATKSEAELGSINTKYMTPLRTLESIIANGVESDGNVILKIGAIQPTPIPGKTIIWINTNS